MKNTTQQYRDLQEGKLSKANFMTNVRRDFPQWISSGNTFDDAVRILKSKRILAESIDRQLLNPQKAAAVVASKHPTISNQKEALSIIDQMMTAAGIPSREIAGAVNDPDWTADYITALNHIIDQAASDYRVPATDYSQRRSREDYGYNRVPADPDIPFSSMTEDETLNEAPLTVKGKVVKTYKQNGDKSYSVEYDDGSQDKIYVSHDDWDKINALHNRASSLNEAEKKEPTIDQVDYIQLQRGTEFEMSKMPVISDENYAKAKQKAHKNLVKDPNAYRHLSVANYKEVKKKDKALETQEVKKDNLADKANEQKTLVKNAKPNTKDTLGKQEKANKGIPDGVKQLREAMLDEFAAVPEIKKEFAVGHEVATPDGKTGTIQELSQDNTATVKFDDDTVRDYQTNVLKPSSEKVIAQHQGAEVNKSFEGKKMSMEELKEKLMKSLEEAAGIIKSKKGVTLSSGKDVNKLKQQAKGLETQTGAQVVVQNMDTGKEEEV